MSDDPNVLRSVPLEFATPELQKQFLDMLKNQRDMEELQKTHLCWFYVPTPTEYERMKKFTEAPNYDKCPKCGKGRVVIEIRHWSMGCSWNAVCRWGVEGCDFKE